MFYGMKKVGYISALNLVNSDRLSAENHGTRLVYLAGKEIGSNYSPTPSANNIHMTVKKLFVIPVPGGDVTHLPNSPWAGIMTSYINYSRLGRLW
jgi:hypothetical protein